MGKEARSSHPSHRNRTLAGMNGIGAQANTDREKKAQRGGVCCTRAPSNHGTS